MGNIHTIDKEEAEQLFQFPQCLTQSIGFQTKYRHDVLSKFTILSKDDPLREEILSYISGDTETLTSKESKAVGCMLGMGIGDALGAPLEFLPVSYHNTTVTGFNDDAWTSQLGNSFSLKPGQWTDDASMGLCLAESLIKCGKFNPIDLRVRFLNWWSFGYRNAFGYDELKHSVGLGGSIKLSFDEFLSKQTKYTTAGDKNTSGNGSIMRLAPVPIYYMEDVEKAMKIAYKQSKTTHQGDEAAECCRLMTFIIISFFNSNDDMDIETKKKNVFELVDENFKTPLYSVECLAKSKDEERHPSNSKLNLDDRKWNWKSNDFKYSVERANSQPGYIGSYSMDGLAMALHCFWSTNTFEDALIKAINLRGDADTVGSITGQIAGSCYGVSSIPKDWIQTIQKWDNNGDFAHTALKLVRKI